MNKWRGRAAATMVIAIAVGMFLGPWMMVAIVSMLGLVAGFKRFRWWSTVRLRWTLGRAGWASSSRLMTGLPRKGTLIGKAVVRAAGVVCRVKHHDVLGVVGAPRTGKSVLMAAQIIEHPGPVLSTSTRGDLYRNCAGARAQRGPVWLFNPENIGGLNSSMRWDPLIGCQDPTRAAERAAALVGATDHGSDDDQTWLESASQVLKAFLLAAALGGYTMRDVHRWVAHPQSAEAFPVLAEHPDVPSGWLEELASVVFSKADKSTASVMRAASLAVAFMSDPVVAEACTPDPEDGFTIERLCRENGSVFLIGTEREFAGTGPLMAAFTTYVKDGATKLGELQGGKLDPVLMLALDEAAVTTRVPLDAWVATAGGSGIHIVWAVQSPSQLFERWGEHGGQTIWNLASGLLVFGGLKNADDLDRISRLCGDVDEDGESGSTKRPLLTVSGVREIPEFHALFVYRSLPATIVKIRESWRDARPTAPVIQARPVQTPVRASQTVVATSAVAPEPEEAVKPGGPFRLLPGGKSDKPEPQPVGTGGDAA